MKSILIPHSSYWHFGDTMRTVCGMYLGPGVIIRDRPASDAKICGKCTKWVGSYMMPEYLGIDWGMEPTTKEIRISCKSPRSNQTAEKEP